MPKTDNALPPFQDIGKNIRARVVDDVLVLRIDLTVKGDLSESGKSYLIGRTARFESLEKIAGEEGLGLSLMVTRRVKKASKPAARRDDDDDA